MKHYVFVAREFDPDYKSASIMFYLKSEYSHAGVIINDTIYHATRKGVHTTPVKEFLKDHEFTHKIDVSDYILDDSFAFGWCEGNLGKDYSESQLIGLVLKPFRQVMGDGKSEMICSEFAARFLDECSVIRIFDQVDVDFVDPVTFIKAVLNYVNN